ncbi:hypothetical protein Ancab_001143 [Ancistrocladus abbreviatus]
MTESGLTVDMGTAVHWSRCLRMIERAGGELTEALQKTFPPDWNSFSSLGSGFPTDADNADLDDEGSVCCEGLNDDDDATGDPKMSNRLTNQQSRKNVK